MSLIQITDSERSIACLAVDAAKHISALCTEKIHDDNPEVSYTFDDEYERLAIWMAQHGAERGELDHKLRETSVLRGRVISLLEELSDPCPRIPATSNVAEDRQERLVISTATPYGHVAAHIPAVIDHGDLSEVQSNSEGTSSGIATDFSSDDSLPDHALIKTHELITLLFELSPTLTNPAPHDRLDSFTHPDAGRYDLDHVVSKFPHCEEFLGQRLGTANWNRRQYLTRIRLKYEKDPRHAPTLQNPSHHRHEDQSARLDSFPSNEDSVDERSESSFDSISSGSLEGDQQSYQRSQTEESRTKTSFNFSWGETKSTAATQLSGAFTPAEPVLENLGTKYAIPHPPKPNNAFTGDRFLCPYCFHFLSDVKSYAEWRSHVFEDIKPYVCTYPNCALAAKTYGSRKAWWEHERERHRAIPSWRCNPCEERDRDSVFNTADEFDAHLNEQHSIRLNKQQLRGIREICLKQDQILPPPGVCPICKENAPVTNSKRSQEKTLRNHISDHLEQLAFFVAFPAGQLLLREDDSEFQDDSDSDEDFRSEIRSVISKDTHLSRKDIRIANVERFVANQKKFEGSLVEGSRSNQPHSQDVHPTTPDYGTEPSGWAFRSRSKEVAFPVKLLMHPPNEHFYAKQDVLETARDVLQSSGSICIFQGIGGVGKTITAVEYVHSQSESFDAIFWMQADTAPGRSDCYHQMALALGLIDGSEDYNQITDKGRMWLQHTDKRWLLVFDNAITWSEISEFLPNELRHANGSILITTQTEDFLPPSDNVSTRQLGTLTQEAGAEMLLAYLKRDSAADPEHHLAKEVSAFVGGLPVAIAHVAGYLEYSEYSLGELIETFQQWRRRAGVATDEEDDLPVSFRAAAFSYDETLAMVWNVTLRELTADSSDVMNVLAYLNCEAIPLSMLFRVHAEPSLHFLDVRERLRIDRVRKSLTRRRLVRIIVVDGEQCLSMHRSLQRGIREGLSADIGKQQKVFDQAVALVRKVFPRSNPLLQPTPAQWAECQRLLPHLHALRDVYYKFSPNIAPSIDFAQLLLDSGADQFERGITREALLLLETAEEILNANSPEDHQVMLANIHTLIAVMYDNTGITKRQEAFDRRNTALAIRHEIYSKAGAPQLKDEMLLYSSEMDFAISLLHYHRYREAEPRIQKCFEKFVEWGSESDIPFEYAKYYNKIAIVRLYQGLFDEAIDFASQSVALMEQTGYILFESRFKFDLACIILQSGDLDRSLRVHKEILNQRLDKLGQTNELTLHSIYAIGAIFELQGKLDKACTYFRKALEQRRSLTSWPDEAFSRAQFHLSRALVARGHQEDMETAHMLREKALRCLSRLLPLDLPPELKHVTDEAILFDHMLPVSPGGTRFTGLDLLPYFMPKR